MSQINILRKYEIRLTENDVVLEFGEILNHLPTSLRNQNVYDGYRPVYRLPNDELDDLLRFGEINILSGQNEITFKLDNIIEDNSSQLIVSVSPLANRYLIHDSKISIISQTGNTGAMFWCDVEKGDIIQSRMYLGRYVRSLRLNFIDLYNLRTKQRCTTNTSRLNNGLQYFLFDNI